VTAWNRTRDKAAATGVAVADTLTAALATADVAIIMLSNAAVIEEVLFGDGPGGRPVSALRPGSALIVMSSIPVRVCQEQERRLKPAGVGYIDAPVSGGEPGARDGTLAIMAGGAPELIAAMTPVFAPLGRVTRIGPVGTGQLSKLANQIIVGGTVTAIAEALHFARVGGADPAAVRTALLGGFAESTILRQHGERMLQQNFLPGGPAMYQLKDMRTAGDLATELGVHLTLLQTVIGMFDRHIEHGDGALDVSSIIREVERTAERQRPIS
jgi:3-hydroxyisobutyrate dehydrogenase-like beta-hydroxyacid dehydrogenase